MMSKKFQIALSATRIDWEDVANQASQSIGKIIVEISPDYILTV